MRVRLNADRLRVELARRGLDGATFARIAQVSPATVSNALQGRAVNPTTLKRFSIALSKTLVVDDVGLIEQEKATA